MGSSELRWTELESWANTMHGEYVTEYVYQGDDQWKPEIVKRSSVKDYELDIIMAMSREYVAESYNATEVGAVCPKPVDKDDLEEADIEEAQSSMLFAHLTSTFASSGAVEITKD